MIEYILMLALVAVLASGMWKLGRVFPLIMQKVVSLTEHGTGVAGGRR